MSKLEVTYIFNHRQFYLMDVTTLVFMTFSLFFPDLFQDLSQLQETWLTEGETESIHFKMSIRKTLLASQHVFQC